jgi:predicted nicotinamide N-methyase
VEYQRKFIRSLFADGDAAGAFDDDNDDNDDNDVSEHIWTCPDASASIVYHLAFRAPGHGNRLWNSSGCIARHLLIPECRSAMLSIGNNKDGRTTEGGRRRREFEWPPANCIEFGAGAALPSLALLRGGARRVVITDRHGDDRTFDALRMSVEANGRSWRMGEGGRRGRAVIMPHTWGEDVDELLVGTGGGGEGDDREASGRKADLLIASDCIYNPTYHGALLRSATGAMDPDADALFVVGYSLHGNVPASRTLDFFDAARRDFGLTIVNEFKIEYPDGQRGIGSEDGERGAVYVKVLTWT